VVEPGGAKVRVRDVQAHGAAVARGGSGQRLALALHGVKKDEMERGLQVVEPGSCTVTHRLDARVTLVPHYQGELKNRQRVHVHHAGREVLGRVVLLDEEVLSHEMGVASGVVQIQLEDTLVARPGDRLVLRFYSPLTTMAGGELLACNPPRRKRFDEAALDELAVLELGDPADRFRQALREAATEGLPAAEHPDFADDPEAVTVGRRLYDRALSAELADRIDELAAAAWAKNPLRGGVGKEEARRKLKFRGGVAEWNAWVEVLATQRGWQTAGDRIGPAGAGALPPELARTVDAVERRLLAAGLEWPDAPAVPPVELGGADLDEVLRFLAARGRAVRVAEGYLVHVDALDPLRETLRAHFAAEGNLNFAGFRGLSGLSRKLGIPLLEYLDAAGITRRMGDLRIAGPVLKRDA
jgi:selenocysteine-specific elongation factor